MYTYFRLEKLIKYGLSVNKSVLKLEKEDSELEQRQKSTHNKQQTDNDCRYDTKVKFVLLSER